MLLGHARLSSTEYYVHLSRAKISSTFYKCHPDGGSHGANYKGRIPRKKRLTADELLFQPWFLSSEIAQAIRVLIPPGYDRKMRDYFDSYGCMRCNREDAVYQSNGMCKLCANMIRIRLRKCIQRRLGGGAEIASAGVFVGAHPRTQQIVAEIRARETSST